MPVVDANAYLDQDGASPVRVIGLPILSDDTAAFFGDTIRATTTYGWMLIGRQDDRIAVSERLARRLDLRVGSTVALWTPTGMSSFGVAAIVRANGLPLGADEIILMRLSRAQAIFAKGESIDRIEIMLVPNADVGAVQAQLAARVGADGVVSRPTEREVADSMLRAFALTAVFLGGVVLIASGFIVFGAVSVRLAERRREVAVWRVLGATRVQTAVLLVVDAVAIGGMGSVVGVGLGALAARSLVHAAAGLVGGATLHAVSIDGMTITPMGLLLPGLAGFAATVCASILAVGAHTIGTDADALRKLRSHRRAHAVIWLRCSVGVVLATAPWMLLAEGFESYAGPLICALFVAATFLVAPPVTAWLARALLGIVQRPLGAPALIAARTLARDRFRFALPITVLALTVEFGTAVGAVAHSFDRGLRDWLHGLTSNSLFVTTSSSIVRRTSGHLDPDLGSSLADILGIARVEPTRQRIVSVAGRDVVLRASGLAVPLRAEDLNRYRFIDGKADAALARLAAGEAVLISENLARRARLQLGGAIDLPSPNGPYRAAIAAIIVDFSAPGGSVIIGRTAYLTHWADAAVDGFFVDIEPSADMSVVRGAIEQRLARSEGLVVLSPSTLIAEVLEMVDRALLPLNAIAAVALVIGLWGMLQALLAATIAAAAEHGAIRAAGASQMQIGTAVLLEGLGATVIGALFGAAAGALGAYSWVRGTIPAITGWVVPYALPLRPALTIIAAVLVLAPLPLLWPALRAARQPVDRWSVV